MRKYKLLALDMDGTLLNRHHAVSDVNRKWIYRALESGITVMFATGREMQSVVPYVEELGLTSPMVCVNGSEVWRAPGVLMTRHVLETQWVKEMHSLAIKQGCRYWAYTVDEVFTKEQWVQRIDPEDGRQWLKFGFHCDNPRQLTEMRAELEATNRYEVTNSSSSNLEVNPLGISKASGIQEVCKLLGIGMDEVAACGDSLNDLKMIRSVGLGVAMGNAQDTVKQAAKVVTASNEENGVAQVIRDYLLD